MSQQKGGAAVTDTHPEEAVADYLRSHPDFFERHGALLLSLKIPHRTGAAAVSLVERQVATLRQRNAQLERQLKDLFAVAKSNDALVDKIHRLALKLMRTVDVGGRIAELEASLRDDFAAERAVLVLFEGATPPNAERAGFVLRLAADDPAIRPFASFLRAGRPRCGPLKDRQKTLFDRDADAMASAALLPLGPDASVGFLAVGSRDPDHFHPGQRVDFLARLGELVSVALTLEQPERARA